VGNKESTKIPKKNYVIFFKMTTSNNLGPTQGPILLGKNYEFWSLRIRSFLQAQECWDPVDLGYVEPDPTALAAMTNQESYSGRTKEKRE
jgi:hypothetical protein